jgi:hypothetical protein
MRNYPFPNLAKNAANLLNLITRQRNARSSAANVPRNISVRNMLPRQAAYIAKASTAGLYRATREYRVPGAIVASQDSKEKE